MKRSLVVVASALALSSSVAVATQEVQLPKKITLTQADKEHRFSHVSSDETLQAQARSADVSRSRSGEIKIVLRNGSYVASNVKSGKKTGGSFQTMQMTFEANGNMIQWAVSR
jgi:hypothetical protein